MKKILLGMAFLLFSLSSHAALITYDLVYTSGGAATGSGFITIDDAVYPNDGTGFTNQPAATIGITAFSLTITGAIGGNGTFGLAEIPSFIWNQSAAYDLTMELVAQAAHADFNLASAGEDPGDPWGVNTNTIQTNSGGAGETLVLISMTPRAANAPTAVPTLSFWGIALMTLLLPFIARRRIKL